MLFVRLKVEDGFIILGVFPIQSAKNLVESIDEHISVFNEVQFSVIRFGGLALKIGNKDLTLNERERVVESECYFNSKLPENLKNADIELKEWSISDEVDSAMNTDDKSIDFFWLKDAIEADLSKETMEYPDDVILPVTCRIGRV